MNKIVTFAKKCFRFINNRIKILIHTVIWTLLLLVPINQRKVVVCSFLGRGYCDNPKYIVEALLKSECNVKIVWLLKNIDEKSTLPNQISVCKYNSIKSVFHLATAGVWIDNTRKTFLYKRKKQLYIQTWHGGGGLKKAEKDVESKLSKRYVKNAKKDSKYIDFIISDSDFMTNFYKNSFWYKGYVIEVGYPRYDLLINAQPKEYVDQIRKKIGIASGKSILLYAPTFRQDYRLDSYNLDFEKIKEALDKKFDSDFIILLRLHPNLLNDYKNYQIKNNNVINVSKYSDIQEILLISDVVISDYSSLLYDFSLTKRPSFCFASDIDSYKLERNFYYDITEYPYPLATTNEGLLKTIQSFDSVSYEQRLKKFSELIGAKNNNNSSNICAQLVIDFINGISKDVLVSKYNAIKFS